MEKEKMVNKPLYINIKKHILYILLGPYRLIDRNNIYFLYWMLIGMGSFF